MYLNNDLLSDTHRTCIWVTGCVSVGTGSIGILYSHILPLIVQLPETVF